MKTSNVICYSFLAATAVMLAGCGGDSPADIDSTDPDSSPTLPPEYIDVNFEEIILGRTRDEIVQLKSSTFVGYPSISQLPTLPEPFSIVEDGCSNQKVSFTSSCSFTIRFAPTEEGSFSHNFDVPSDADNTVTVRINGTAVAESTAEPKPQPPISEIPVINSVAQGVAFDASGNLYISTASGKVAKLEAGSLSTFIPAGGAGMAFGKRIRYSQENFYILNTLGLRSGGPQIDTVLLFTSAGGFIREIVREGSASPLNSIADIAVNSRGQLYAIASNRLVDRIDTDGSNLTTVINSGDGGIFVPTSLTVDSQGNLYVGTPSVVSKFDADGNFIRTIVAEDNPGSSGFEFASHLAVDSAGNLYVGNIKGVGTSKPSWNVLKFNSDGVFEGEFVAAGTGGLSSAPEDMTIDAQGALYVADSSSETIAGVAKFTSEGSFDRIVAKNFAVGSTTIRSLQSALSTEVRQLYEHELDLKAKALAKASSQQIQP